MLSINFSFTPYIAIIGDIVKSKETPDRKAVQNKLGIVLQGINETYPKELASRFMITLGDEFQGLLLTGVHTMDIIERVEREMYPVRMRFGIGIGRIMTDIDPDLPLGADGPAYYNARKMISELKNAEKKKMEPKLNMKIGIEEQAEIANLVNTIFSLNTVLKERWTDRQREIIGMFISHTGTQSDVAQKLGINQSSVQKALASSNFYTYQKALTTITKILSNIKEKRDV